MKSTLFTELLPKAELFDRIKNPDLFQHPSWLNAVEEGLNYRCFGLLTEYEKRPAGIAIYFKCRKGGLLKLAGSPLPWSFTPYIEPLWLEDVGDEIKAAILNHQHEYLRKKGFLYIEQRLKDRGLADAFRSCTGQSPSFRETFVVEIENDYDAMWKKMAGRSRTAIKKAEKSGVKIVECNGTPAEIELFYEMLKIVFAKAGKLPEHPKALYSSIVRNLMQLDRLLLLSAVLEEKTIAMGLFMHDDSQIYYLSGASLGEGYNTGANNLIQWWVLKFAVDKGLKSYDLGGKGSASIEKFKAAFGGDTCSYARIIRKSRIAAVAESAFLRVSSLRERIKFMGKTR